MQIDFNTKPNQVILYMDMLGFRNAIMDNNGNLLSAVITLNFEAFENIIRDMFFSEEENNPVKFLWMSDSFMLSTDISHINELLSYMFEIQKQTFISALPVRGAICIGNLHHDKNIWGEALVRAVQLEETISKYPRIIISNDDYERLSIQQEYTRYFKSFYGDDEKNYKYINPISHHLDECLGNAFRNSNGIWAVLDISIGTIEDQIKKYSNVSKVSDKWIWLAQECKSALQDNEQIICEALKIDQIAGMRPQDYDTCLKRLDKIIERSSI